MKLNLPILDHSIEVRNATIFTVKAPEIFAQIISKLYTLDEGSDLKLFSEDQKRLNKNDLLVVIDILGFDPNSTTFQRKILKDIEEQLNFEIEKKIEIEELLGKLYSLFEYEVLEHELDLEISELTLSRALKAFQPHLTFNESNILEKMLDIVKVYSYLQNAVKLLIFVNARSFLTETEYEELRSFVILSNVKTLFLESTVVPAQRQYILDEDYYLDEPLD